MSYSTLVLLVRPRNCLTCFGSIWKLDCFRWFIFSVSKRCKIAKTVSIQMLPNASKCFQMLPNSSNKIAKTASIQMLPNASKCFQMLPNASKQCNKQNSENSWLVSLTVLYVCPIIMSRLGSRPVWIVLSYSVKDGRVRKWLTVSHLGISPVHRSRRQRKWLALSHPDRQSARLAYLSWKLDEIGRNWYRSRIGRRLRGKSGNVYSGTRTFWLFRDQTNRKSVYRSTHFHFCPSVSVQFGFCTNLVRFRFSSLNKLVERTV